MSRSDCASCSACKGINKTYCDNCSASCCQENMKNHREIFYLGDQFSSKVNNAENELKSKADQVKNNLLGKYNTYISDCTCCLEHCENFLNSMKNKYNEMNNRKDELDCQIEQKKRTFENDKINLSNDFNQKLKNLNNSFEEKRKVILNNIDSENQEKQRQINSLKESKIKLGKVKENIIDKNAEEIANDFINGEKTQMENDFKNQKNKIDEDNQITIENLEYSEDEKNLEKNYLNIINSIKDYSKKIPFFDNWIKVYNLNKYIN